MQRHNARYNPQNAKYFVNSRALFILDRCYVNIRKNIGYCNTFLSKSINEMYGLDIEERATKGMDYPEDNAIEGYYLIRQGNYKIALKLFHAYIEMFGEAEIINLMQAKLYLAVGKREEAVYFLKRIIENGETYPKVIERKLIELRKIRG